MITYRYITVDVEAMLAASTVPDLRETPDCYLAMTHDLDIIRTALAEGFRWIRTDNNMAVLEKTVLPHSHDD